MPFDVHQNGDGLEHVPTGTWIEDGSKEAKSQNIKTKLSVYFMLVTKSNPATQQIRPAATSI